MENLTIYCWAGPKERRPTTRASAAQHTVQPTPAPACARRLTSGTRATERQTGEEKETAAQLVAGGSSGEVRGATKFALPVRI